MKILSRFSLFFIPLLAALSVSPAFSAAPPRTFVASTGNDTNGCTRTAPCRTFGAAIAMVATGGDVIVLDSAGYGPVIITKPVSLISPNGIYAGISAPLPPGGFPATLGAIKLFGLTSADAVRLKGLTITSQAPPDGFNTIVGVLVTSDCQLEASDLVFSGLTAGIWQQDSGHNTELLVENTLFRSCTYGAYISAPNGFTKATFNHCTAKNGTGAGFYAGDNTHMNCIDCQALGFHNASTSNGAGYEAVSTTTNGIYAEITLERCLASYNDHGVYALNNGDGSYAYAYVSNSTLTYNASACYRTTNSSNVSFYSRGNNTSFANNSDVCATTTYNQQ